MYKTKTVSQNCLRTCCCNWKPIVYFEKGRQRTPCATKHLPKLPELTWTKGIWWTCVFSRGRLNESSCWQPGSEFGGWTLLPWKHLALYLAHPCHFFTMDCVWLVESNECQTAQAKDAGMHWLGDPLLPVPGLFLWHNSSFSRFSSCS